MPVNINITVICSSLNELTLILEYVKSKYPEILIQVSPTDADGARGKEEGSSHSPSTLTGALSPQPSAGSVMPPSDSLRGVPADPATLKTPTRQQALPSASGASQDAQKPYIPPSEKQLNAIRVVLEHREGAAKRMEAFLQEKRVHHVSELTLDDAKYFLSLYPVHNRRR